MPAGLQMVISKSELRDLIEFLAQQKKPAKKPKQIINEFLIHWFSVMV